MLSRSLSSPHPGHCAPIASSGWGVLAALGTGVGLALGDASSWPSMSLAVAGLLVIPFALLAVIASAARARVYDSATAHRAAWFSLAFALLLIPLGRLGAALKTHTHQRALAGVTFALLGLGIALGCLVFAYRIYRILSRTRAWNAAVFRAASYASLVVGLLATLIRARLWESASLDPLMMLVALGLGWALPLRTRRYSRFISVFTALALGAFGIATWLLLQRSPAIADAIEKRGLIAGAILSWIR